MPNKYKIVWWSRMYGESAVDADTPEEARELAKDNKDSGFEILDPSDDWEIDSVILIE